MYYSPYHSLNQTETRETSSETFNITLYKPTWTFNHPEVNIKKYSKYRTYANYFGEKETGHIQIVNQNINCLGVN